MQIWLDLAPAAQTLAAFESADDCERDCDCDDPEGVLYASYIKLPLRENELESVRARPLKQAVPLYLQECTPGRWLVCNPTGPGHIAVVDEAAKKLLDQFHTARTTADVVSLLADEVPERVEKMIALLYQAELLQNDTKPEIMNKNGEAGMLTAWLHVTNACNLRCQYCYLEKTSESMSKAIALRAVDAVFRSAHRHHYKRVKLKYAGGEASLHMASVIALHDYALQVAQQHDITLYASILSNGVSLSQRAIDHLKSRNIRVMISLDGLGTFHDSQRPFVGGQATFRYVERTIQRLLTAQFIPHISVTVSRRNLEGLADLLMYLLEYRLPFTLNYYRDNDYATDSHELQFGEQHMIQAMRQVFGVIERHLPERSLLGSLLDKADMRYMHRYTCGVGRNYLVIDQQGGIAKCHANIKQTVGTIDVHDPLQVVRADRAGVQNVPVEEKEGCRTCDWRYWCTGGCPLLTHRTTGRYDIKSPNCHIYQALFPEVLRLEALRLLKYNMPCVL